MKHDPDEPLVSEDEASVILRAAVDASGEAGQTKEDLIKVLDWATGTRLNEGALKLVLRGQMGAYIRDGEMFWKTLP